MSVGKGSPLKVITLKYHKAFLGAALWNGNRSRVAINVVDVILTCRNMSMSRKKHVNSHYRREMPAVIVISVGAKVSFPSF